ncbi:hypothetical protein AB0C58_06415 [Streptomyces parvulus]
MHLRFETLLSEMAGPGQVAAGRRVTAAGPRAWSLDTAHGHILLSDAATRDDGLRVLGQAARTAAQYGLVHQLRSIESVKASSEGPPGAPPTVIRETNA